MAINVALGPTIELDPKPEQIDVLTTNRDEVFGAIYELPLGPAVREEIAETAVDDWRINDALAVIRNFDEGTFKHVLRVAALGRHLAVLSGFEEEEKKILLMGALLHDLGKVDIDPAIINSSARLSDYERQEINRHPELGFRRATNVFEAAPEGCYRRMVPQIVLTHHRHNASGTPYPSDEALQVMAAEGAVLLDELDDMALKETTELVAVADVYDAITSGRSYNNGRFVNPMAVRKVLSESHPSRPRAVDSLMALHYVRFPGGRMPTVDMSDVEQ